MQRHSPESGIPARTLAAVAAAGRQVLAAARRHNPAVTTVLLQKKDTVAAHEQGSEWDLRRLTAGGADVTDEQYADLYNDFLCTWTEEDLEPVPYDVRFRISRDFAVESAPPLPVEHC